jgi:soluble lytic murein transglycosylase-like protein
MPALIALLACFGALAAEAADVSMREAMRAAVAKQRAAVAAQREAVRQQAQSVRVRGPELPALARTLIASPPACDPIPEQEVAPIIEAAAASEAVSSKLLRAVIEQESGWRACAVSPKGAAGLMQLMPATMEDLGVRDPFDPRESVGAGARFLKQLLGKYNGDISLALGAYNAGPSAVDEAGGIPEFQETRDYVAAILRRIGK